MQSKLSMMLLAIVFLFYGATAQNRTDNSIPPMPKLLAQREQAEAQEMWLKKRLGSLMLPMMKRHGVEMWIVVNEEFHTDPVTPHITPMIPIVGRRDVFVFIDQGERIERVALVRYAEERLKNHYRMVLPARDKFGDELRKLVDGRNPKTIALNIGGTRGQQSGLTYDGYKFLADALGPENEKRFISAADLLTEFFDTRLPEELEHYRTAVLATDIITRRAFSNEFVKPGKTTAGDIRWWMLEQLNDIGVDTWFQPDIRIQRKAVETGTTSQFLSTASESDTIMPGDLIHVDFGLNYMGLSTDWQKHAYVLRPGEKDAPAGLKAALKNTNRLQDIILNLARPGMTGAEVYEASMAECKKQNINCQIYSHPIGTHGHGLGPSIDFRGLVGGGGNKILPGSYESIELNTATNVPEWNNQRVTIMAEDDAHMTPTGYKFFRPRQTAFYLIK